MSREAARAMRVRCRMRMIVPKARTKILLHFHDLAAHLKKTHKSRFQENHFKDRCKMKSESDLKFKRAYLDPQISVIAQTTAKTQFRIVTCQHIVV